jgi:DUF971 family protein
MDSLAPASIDLKKDRGLTILWHDGSSSYYTIAYLRRMSPSADMKQLRAEMQRNPLTVLPAAPPSGGVTAVDAELVGTYALRLRFSDGHSTGIYSWAYLREIDPARQRPDSDPDSEPNAGPDTAADTEPRA